MAESVEQAKLRATERLATILKLLGGAAERLHVEMDELAVEAFEAIDGTLTVDDEGRRIKEVDYGYGVSLRAIETEAKLEVVAEDDNLFAGELFAS